MSLLSKTKITVLLASVFCVVSGNAHAQAVAVLDSGVDDPDSSYNIASGFNYFLETSDTSDVSQRDGEGHGTVSVRLISEAFSGNIVPFVVTDGEEQLNESQVRVARDNALSDILGRDEIRVVGITWGTSGVAGSSASLLPELSRSNKVVAIMAGNDIKTQPNALATSAFNLGGVIIVGGTDANGNLFPETNRAGTTANKYVATNGLPNSGATSGGSSWATARISGIAGAVLQQNPDLTAAEVVDIILQSAEDRGAVGTDTEYGRGYIANAQQVLDNVIGPVVIPVTPEPEPGGGGGGGGGTGALLIGGALVGALLLMRKPNARLEKTLVLDSYGRAFEVDLTDQIGVNDPSIHLNEFFTALDQTTVGDGFYLPGLKTEVAFGASTKTDHRIDMIKYFGMPDDVVLADDPAQVSFAMRSQLTSELDLTAGYQVSPNQIYGAVSQLDSDQDFGSSSFLSGQSFSSVLSGFSSQGHTASLAYTPSKFDKTSLKLGLVSVDQAHRFGQDSFSTIIEGAYQFSDNAGVSLQFGQIEEQGSLFGGAAGGVFGVETATTYAVNVGGRIKASDRFSIVANYGIGRTYVDASNDSLLSDFSNLRSDWYSVGLIGNDLFRAKDQLGVAFSQPLKVTGGSVNYSIPTSRELNGNIVFDNERINLSETGATEQSLEGYYRTMLTNNLELGGFAAYRQNPNHVSENGNEALVMATVRFRR